MKRREFVALFGGVVVWPIAGHSQQSVAKPTLGVLMLSPQSASVYQSFLRGLQDLGWIEGRSIHIEYRGGLSIEQLPQAAVELVEMRVDIIFAGSSTLVEPARQATKTIPIVSGSHADPVVTGHAESSSRPGGNITGLTSLSGELAAKRRCCD